MLVEGTSSTDISSTTATTAAASFNGNNSGMEDTTVPCTSTNSNMDYLTEALKLHENVPDTPVETENLLEQEGGEGGKGKSEEMNMIDIEGVKFSGIPVVKAILDTKQKVDTVIVCSDGRIGAHRLVLTAASQFMGLLFDDQKLGEIAVVLLPDITKKTMISLLHLAYTGQMLFTEDEQAEVLSAMECLLFCQTGNIACIPVKIIPPSPEPGPSRTESTGFHQGSKSKQEKRKRHEDSSPSKLLKKRRLDENGHRVQIGIRSGTPIGKKGAKKLRRKSQEEQLKRGEGICSPPDLKSDPVTKTVSLNVSTMPLCSIRIRPIEDHVCIEIHKKRKPAWLTKHRQENEKKSTTATTDKKDDKRLLVESQTTSTTTTLSSSLSVQPKNLELKEKDSVSTNKNSNNNNNSTNKVHCLKSSDTRPLIESKKGSVSPLSIGKNSEDTESGIMDINKPINDELIPCTSTKKNTESENKKKGENSNASSSSGHGSDSDNH